MLLTTAESSHYSVAEVAGRFQVDPRVGLKWQEANSRTKIIGYNELPAVEEDPPWKKYIEQFRNPLILLLLGKSVSFFELTLSRSKNIIVFVIVRGSYQLNFSKLNGNAWLLIF